VNAATSSASFAAISDNSSLELLIWVVEADDSWADADTCSVAALVSSATAETCSVLSAARSTHPLTSSMLEASPWNA
jgi:hypothetical protein